MRIGRTFSLLAVAAICSLLLTVGCAQVGKQPVTVGLNFMPQDVTTYKVTTENEMSLKFEGALPAEEELKDKRNYNKVEMIFNQQTESVNDQGNAVVKITIEGLKCLGIEKNKTALDFDSSREEDQSNPLAKLIGQSYWIEVAPTGQVSKVLDAKEASASVRGKTAENRAALNLLAPNVIRARHSISGLPAVDKNRLHPGDNWSQIRVFNFPIIGSKSYERVYTLKEIKETDNREIATIVMNAIPTSVMAQQLHEKQEKPNASEIFDNTETYNGQLEVDLASGKIEKYIEKLESQWVFIIPSAGENEEKEPVGLKMGATRVHSIERMD